MTLFSCFAKSTLVLLPTLENLEEEVFIVLTIKSTILDNAESIVTLPPSGPLLNMTISLIAVVWACEGNGTMSITSQHLYIQTQQDKMPNPYTLSPNIISLLFMTCCFRIQASTNRGQALPVNSAQLPQ